MPDSKMTRLEAAVRALLRAYAYGGANDAGIEWEDLDEAFELAQKALPGVYEEMLKSIGAQ